MSNCRNHSLLPSRPDTGACLLLFGIVAISALISGPVARAADWPQWRGPNRDGISKETGWSSKWSDQGPKKLWQGSVGIGYSSFSVSGGKLYTMGNVREVDNVLCFDAETGKQLWK